MEQLMNVIELGVEEPWHPRAVLPPSEDDESLLLWPAFVISVVEQAREEAGVSNGHPMGLHLLLHLGKVYGDDDARWRAWMILLRNPDWAAREVAYLQLHACAQDRTQSDSMRLACHAFALFLCQLRDIEVPGWNYVQPIKALRKRMPLPPQSTLYEDSNSVSFVAHVLAIAAFRVAQGRCATCAKKTSLAVVTCRCRYCTFCSEACAQRRDRRVCGFVEQTRDVLFSAGV
jgi:hypothetical protein